MALLHELIEQCVDLLLGAHIDASSRLVKDQHLAVSSQPFRNDDLLLVAAGKVLDLLHGAGSLDT